MRIANEHSGEKFIIAAIEEMQKHGISDFSIRRVARQCGMSSGAPYKHFKNKNELILEAIKYINKKWSEVQRETIAVCGDDPRTLLVEISIAYVKFLCANPAFQSVLMLNDNSLQPEQLEEKARISGVSVRIISDYCRSVGMSEEDRVRKTYAVRSFIYGAAVMINSGFFRDDTKAIALARSCIEREFDID